MRKRFAYFFSVLLTLILVPVGVSASEVTVKSQEELLLALDNKDVSQINLGADINTTQKINVTRDVIINGNDYTIKYIGKFRDGKTGVESNDNTVWHSPVAGTTPVGAIYVIQVFNANVTIKDISLINGNRALGINGGKLVLDGTIDVSGNGFDAIELGHGSAPADKISTLVVSDETFIINNSENSSNSTLFVDDADAKIIRSKDGKSVTEDLVVGTKLSCNEVNVNIIEKIDNNGATVSSDVFKDIINNKNLILTTEDEKAIWMFDGNKIKDTNISINTGITFTQSAPEKIKSDVSKVTTNYEDKTFLNFAHSGKLPGIAELSYKVDDTYAIGTKLYIAHFNESTKKLDSVQEVEVDEDGYITFNVEECSSYVLYTGIDANNSNTSTNVKNQANDSANATNVSNTTTSNPKTGDINLILILSVIVSAIGGLRYVSKKIALKIN